MQRVPGGCEGMEAAGVNTFLSGPGERSSPGRVAPVTAHREAQGKNARIGAPNPAAKDFFAG